MQNFFERTFGVNETRNYEENRETLRRMLRERADALDNRHPIQFFSVAGQGEIQAGAFYCPSIRELVTEIEDQTNVSQQQEAPQPRHEAPQCDAPPCDTPPCEAPMHDAQPIEAPQTQPQRPPSTEGLPGAHHSPTVAAVASETSPDGGVQISHIFGTSVTVHRCPAAHGAVIQAASQFNCLEMVHPHVTPEDGIVIYSNDATQGPQCAICCAAGTAVRNYLYQWPDGSQGQTSDRQINTFADSEAIIMKHAPPPTNGATSYFTYSNGYMDVENEDYLRNISTVVEGPHRDDIVNALRIGVQRDTAVIGTANICTQTYNSAVGISYSALPYSPEWEPLCRTVLYGTYKATLLVGVQSALRRQRQLGLIAAHRAGPTKVFLTMVGGGVFRNKPEWICAAINQAVRDVDIVAKRARVSIAAYLVHFRQYSDTYLSLIPGDRCGDVVDLK